MKSDRNSRATTCLLVLCGLMALVPHAAKGAGESQDLTLSTNGLHHEEIITNIFRGNFVDIPFDRDDSVFIHLFDAYIKTYASHCTSSLPKDRIELTYQKCASRTVTTNGWGVQTSDICTEWKTVGMGLYASPEMHHANEVLGSIQAGDAFRNLFQGLKQQDLIGHALASMGDLHLADADMKNLLRTNDCESAGLKRFEANLRSFALNKPPIRLGESATGGTKKADAPSLNQNFAKLADDLIYQHSKKWVMNRYQRGSISGVTVTSRDAQGRPSELRAKYAFEGFTGRSNGSVRITFSDGLPSCLYFFDFPATCRTADRRVVAAYASNGYQEQ